MKANLYTICLMLCILEAHHAFSTIVSGNVTGTWNTAGSPYYVTGDIIVVDSLIIEAGVVVKFTAGGWHFNVENGDHFAARGTAQDSIVFEPDIGSNPGSWEWLLISNSGTDDTVSYVHFRNAVNALKVTGSGCAPYIEHSLMEGCSIAGSNVIDRPAPYFYDCTFAHNQTAGAYIYSSLNIGTTAPVFYKCRFYGNADSGLAIRTDNFGVAIAEIVNCTIVQNTGDGIELTETGNPGEPSIDVVNSIIAFNGDKGIDDYTNNMTTDGVTHSLFWGNGTGDIAGFDAIGFGETGNFFNGNGDSCDVNLNIYYDPMFCDTAAHEYALSTGSPAIDAGTSLILGTIIQDPDGSAPDLGSQWPAVCAVSTHQVDVPVVELQCFPNPFSESISVRISTLTPCLVSVMDLTGRHVKTLFDAGVSSFTWNGRTTTGAEVPPGMYLVTVIADGQRYTQRVVKQ